MAMDTSNIRRNKRSSSNLNLLNLTISPLTTENLPRDDDEEEKEEDGGALQRRTSYIQSVSTPSTPSILSSHASFATRRPYRSFGTLPLTHDPPTTAGYFDSQFPPSEQPQRHSQHPYLDKKAKSTTYLLATGGGSGSGGVIYERSQQRKRLKQLQQQQLQNLRRADSTDWIHRAGVALTSGTKESKGQSWLISRQGSSTSLGDDENVSSGEDVFSSSHAVRSHRNKAKSYNALLSSEIKRLGLTDGKDGVYSSSTGASRRMNRARSASSLQQKYGRAVRMEEEGDMSHPFAPEFIDATFVGDDFGSSGVKHRVNDEEEVVEDEEEVGDEDAGLEFDDEDGDGIHWTDQQRSGFGAWIDRLMGFSLFYGDDDYSSEDEVFDEIMEEERRRRRNVVAGNPTSPTSPTLGRRRGVLPMESQEEHEREEGEESLASEEQQQQQQGNGGENAREWGDAAWIFAIATRVLL